MLTRETYNTCANIYVINGFDIARERESKASYLNSDINDDNIILAGFTKLYYESSSFNNYCFLLGLWGGKYNSSHNGPRRKCIYVGFDEYKKVIGEYPTTDTLFTMQYQYKTAFKKFVSFML